MRNRVVCFFLVLCVGLGVTACGGEPTPPSADEAATTTTQTSTSAETTAITSATTSVTTTTTTTTAATTTATTVPADAPQMVASPFVGVTIVKIDLYDTHRFQMEEAILVKSLTEAAETADVTRRLSATSWEYFPNQDKWVKFYPFFAEWALVLTDTDGKQWVLHLYSDDAGWASLGTFDAGIPYADIIAQAKAHDKEGVEDFRRHKIDADTLAYLLSLF